MLVHCTECGMSYEKGISGDEKKHRTYHDPIVHGLYARPLKSDRIIWQDTNNRITVVTPNSPPAQRRRAGKVSSIANRDTEYDGGIYDGGDVPEHLNPTSFYTTMAIVSGAS